MGTSNMEIFTYKGYQGSIETSVEDDVLHGKILFINDLVTYEAETLKQLRQEFEAAVDDYLDTCQQLNKVPNKPLTGQFNVRVGEELHKRVTIRALKSGTSLNAVIISAIEAYLNEDGDLFSLVHNHNHKHEVIVKLAESSHVAWATTTSQMKFISSSTSNESATPFH